ncbi:MAG TPA: DUF1598 domain-containing protein [Pirellulales bacterium]|nr:DUF1598 domain-containing protein [Pirellulales bacterium]
MRSPRLLCAFAGLLVVGGLISSPPWAVAQTTGTSGSTGSTGTGVSTGTSGANGIMVDAAGVLRLQHFADPGGQLVRKRIAEAKAHLNPQVAKHSKLRKVSLNRLEAALRAQLDQGGAPSEEMQFLAGLIRVRYLFYYPDTKDIVLAGPAEGWAADATGRMCGIESGRPALQLQDLVVALRAFPPAQAKTPIILCSIDPTPEGLSRMQAFLHSVGSQINPEDTEMIVNGLRTNLGMQNIRIGGVPPNTHYAQVLLECDYRMKLIGIGLEKPPVHMVNYVDRASPSQNRNALQRWFFIPDYHSVRVAADRLGLELVGDGVKLVNEDQAVSKDGGRSVTGKVNKASDLFTKTFTLKYPELASRVPVFAEMRNLIDLAIVAAFIHKEDLYSSAGWSAETFNDEQLVKVETYQTPLQVETVCTAVWKGAQLFTPVGGGVTIRAPDALQTSNSLPDEDGKISELRETMDMKDLPADRWWWD